MKCITCDNDTTDMHRICMICKQPLCWNCVTRVAVTVHGPDGETWEEPMYLCRNHLKERLGYAIREKYRKNMKGNPKRTITLTNMMDILNMNYPKKGD